ncbi:pilus assembly protein FimV [Janthinobacterium sp. TND4EL3]|uniref:FimV/HubP family polar landmark protein n=1 Tax=Janthinobacterium sp. TND4EL3 TaxID=1907311 RepID=UPI00095640D4|nr:FimV/HubP family polar landmark protein [Janthinobacterium sp. TND4EL3]SIQ41738.1 pilus assembly protein FimV [Janthinobacterium sp. TND4EL3]
MPVHTRPRVASLAIKTLSSAVACAVLLSPAASAAELGKITVLSAAGQPLRAEVELSAIKPGEASTLLAKLAPPEAYRQANVEFNPALNALTFAVENRNGKPFIRISSAQAVAEPMVDLLLELSSKSGRQVREYAFVLDTPEARQTRGAQVTAPVEPGKAKPAAAAAAADTAPAKKAAGEYKVKAGDTLSRIASELKPSGVSLDMMLVALYRANPDAFKGENMNRMQAGRILAVPGADTIRATSAAEAKGIVTAHAIDFEAYRNKLAGQVAQSKPAKAAQAAQSTAGKIGATKVQEKPTAVSESQDKLKLSKAEPAAKSAGKSAVASEEDKIAKAKQVEEAAARVKELEKNVSDLEKLMAVKSKAMADKSAPAPAKPAEAAASAPASAAASAIASAPAEAQPPVPKAKPVPLVKKPSPLEPTITDKINDHLGAIGIGIAALLAAVAALVVARRRKDAPPAPESVAPVFEPEPPAAPPAGPAPEDQQSEASNHLFGTGAAAAGVAAAAGASMLDANETDPVAEADVYIAYGRDGQAEDILKEALRIHPERHAARLKLLEIYSARNDARAFEDQASELYSLTRGQGEEWPQAAALGLALDPTNPLYGDTEDDAVVSLSKGADDGLRGHSMDLPENTQAPAPLVDLAPAEPVASVAQRDTREPLDFDLDSLDFEPVSTSDPIVMPGPEATPSAPAHEAQYDASMDFGLDLEPPAGPVNGVGAGLAPLPDPLTDVDLAHFDLDEPVSPATTPAAPVAAAEPSIDSLFDDAQAPAALPDAIPPARELDLSGIDLDLHDNKPASVGVDDPLSAMHMEMDTKLDLAIAYQEIGDKEGARELIDEVIKGGSEEQVAKANTMKALLS